MGSDVHGGPGIGIEDDAPFDVAVDLDDCGNPFAAVGFLFHAHVADTSLALQALGEHSVGGVDERLDQLHLHDYFPPALTVCAVSTSSPMT